MDPKNKINIVSGPNKLNIEHSLFGEDEQNSDRKMLGFKMEGGGHLIGMVIVSGTRKDPYDPVGHDWILWAVSGGAKFIIEYSTRTRQGEALQVNKFPNYGFN